MIIRKIHIFLAPITILILMWLIISGVLLNHSVHLKLDKKPLPDILLFSFNVAPPENVKHWKLDDAHLVQIDEQYYWKNRKLDIDALQAVYPTNYGWILLGTHQLWLVDSDGLEIATLSLPETDISLISTEPVKVQNTLHCWELSASLSDWTNCQVPSGVPPRQISANQGSTPQAIAQWKVDHHLTWEQFLLRVHSGKIFGAWGLWFLDGFALLLIGMIWSGFRLYRQQAKRPRAKD